MRLCITNGQRVADEPLLGVVVEIDRWLALDRERGYEQRLQRDREIGRTLNQTRSFDRVLAWWEQLADSAPDHDRGHRVVKMRRLAVLALLISGFVTGGFVTSAAFAYDGSYPVNLLLLLSVLVGVPGLLLLLTLLALPGWVPGMRTLGDTFAALSLGRWALHWIDRVGHTDLAGSLPGGRRHSRFARWQLVVFSQWFAVGFFAGALLVAWSLVAFTDLAFGWSTTLDLDSADVHGFFALLAWPWAAWLPAALPDLNLTEASQYLRLAGAETSKGEAMRLGQWWPFVLMVMLCYGLLPRLLLLGFGTWRVHQAIRAWLLDNPEVSALLDRLDSPSLTYAAAAEDLPEDSDTAAVSAPALTPDARLCALIWNDALTVDAARQMLQQSLHLAPQQVLTISVLEDEQQWQAELERMADGVESLVILTKGWEPPLLEFVDFLESIRQRLGDAIRFAVVPVDVTGTTILPADRRVWARALARIDDTALYVMDAPGGSQA